MLPSSRFTLLAAAAVVGLAGVSAARAGIIYQDTFNRTGPLNGSSPTTVNAVDGGSSGATWTAPSWNTDGTEVVLGSGAANVEGAASLPFTPQAGFIYTISETTVWANVPTTGLQNGAWLALGYSASNGGGGKQYNQVVNPSAWMLMRSNPASNNENEAFFGSPSTSIGTAGGTTDIALVLNTQSSHWTLDWYVNSTSVYTATFTTNPTISTVSFGNNGYSNGNSNTLSAIQNFTLSADVPEPAALGLLAIGGVALLLGKRRKVA